MAADVSSLLRLMNGGDASEAASGGQSTGPMTRDLLAGCCAIDSKELDLDLQVPCGWEKRLDLKSGKVYLQRCDSSNSSPSTSEKTSPQSITKFQDLNFPPTSNKQQPMTLLDEPSLDLKLVSSTPAQPASSSAHNYQSVCTLDKVKWALERAHQSEKKRSISMSKSSSSIHSNSSSSIKDGDLDQEERSCGSYAAGCPCCLMYVLISSNNPRCPRCNSNVPVPFAAKKPRIDLNMSI